MTALADTDVVRLRDGHAGIYKRCLFHGRRRWTYQAVRLGGRTLPRLRGNASQQFNQVSQMRVFMLDPIP